MTARVLSIQVGRPLKLAEPQPWRSAIFKNGVTGPIHVGRTNLDGDRQADLRVHGGPDQAVLCYSAGHYPEWNRSLRLEMSAGAFGENFTIDGLDEWTTCIGDVYEIGEATLQVTQHRGPCFKLGYRWGVPELLELVTENGRSGWYLRVLKEGLVQAGQEIRVVDRPNPGWTVNRAYRAWRDRKREPEEAVALLACQAIGVRQRAQLEGFVGRGRAVPGEH